MFYEIDPTGPRGASEWSRVFDRLVAGQLDRIKARAEAKRRATEAVELNPIKQEKRS